MYGYNRGSNQLHGNGHHVPMIKEIWIKKDEFGFGFSVAGQNMCHVNHVIPGSPADRAGLRQMEYIILINGKNVRQMPHESIVRELDRSGNVLKLGICDGKYNQLYSMDNFVVKPHIQSHHIDHFEREFHEPFQEMRWKDQWNQNRIPVRNPSLTFEKTHYDDDDDNYSDEGDPMQHRGKLEVGLPKKKLNAYCREKHLEEISQKRIEAQNEVLVPDSCKTFKCPLVEKVSNVSGLMNDTHISRLRLKHEMSKQDKENKLSRNHVEKSNSRKKETQGDVSLNSNNVSLFLLNYINSVDIPDNLRLKSYADVATMAAKRVHPSRGGEKVVLLFTSGDGLKLINRSQHLIGNYSMECIKWCGEPPTSEGRRLFVVVVSSREGCNTCHIFCVDPTISHHSKHEALSNVFGIMCSKTSDHTCLEYPKTVDEVVCCIAPCIKQANCTRSRHKLPCDETFNNKVTDSSSCPKNEYKKQGKPKFVPHDLSTPRNEKSASNNEGPPMVPIKSSIKSKSSLPKPFIPSPSQVTDSNRGKHELKATPIKRIFTSTPSKSPFNKRNDSMLKKLVKINADQILSQQVTPIREAEQNSSLSLNKSISASCDGFLDDIDKIDKICRLDNDVYKNLSMSSGDIHKMQGEKVGQAGQWAVNFEFLLNDDAGVATFMQFLRKEFSSENLLFWLKCNEFKKLFDSPNVDRNAVKGEVKDIYATYISKDAKYEVNIDWTTRNNIESRMNEDPTSLYNIFNAAQKHIQQLMKQDKYVRFKMSDLYMRALSNEKNGKSFEYPSLKEGKESEMAVRRREKPKGEDKRKSLLNFWKNRKSVVRQSLSSNNPEGTFLDDNSSLKSTSMNNLRPPSLSSSNSFGILRGKGSESYCRAILPHNGVMARILTSDKMTVAECLSKLGSNIDPGMPFINPVDEETGRLVALSDPSIVLSNKIVSFQRLGYLRLDLPNCKPLLVRFKIDESLFAVLVPVLSSLGFDRDDVMLRTNNVILPIAEWKIDASLFNCKTIIVENKTDEISHTRDVSSILKHLEVQQHASNINALRDLFSEMLPQTSKNTPITTFFCYLAFNENGVSNLNGAEEWFRSQRKTRKSRLFNFMKRTSSDRSTLQTRMSTDDLLVQPSVEDPIQSSVELPEEVVRSKTNEKQFINLLSKAQSWNFEEQRGKCSAQYMKLPDFLKEQDEVPSAEDVEICPDLLPVDNRFVIDRRNQRDNFDFPEYNDAFERMDNNWDELLNEDDKMSLFGRDGIIPTVEEADLFFSGGASPPPLTIIERGDDDYRLI